jgi:branched-chain amino acid transport system substrate-binding protein
VGDGVRAHAEKRKIKLIYDEGYDQFSTDMTPIVQKLKDVKPDIVIAISFPNDAILFQRKAKEIDFNVAAFVGVSAGCATVAVVAWRASGQALPCKPLQ